MWRDLRGEVLLLFLSLPQGLDVEDVYRLRVVLHNRRKRDRKYYANHCGEVGFKARRRAAQLKWRAGKKVRPTY